MMFREQLKRILGAIPTSAGLYQSIKPHIVPPGCFNLSQLPQMLPGWVAALDSSAPWLPSENHKRVLIVGMLKWWFDYAVALGILLKAAGHHVDLAYLPYRDWSTPVTRFDALRGMQYIRSQLGATEFPLGLISLMDRSGGSLDAGLQRQIDIQTKLDVQYTLQRENIDLKRNRIAGSLYRLRHLRNQTAAINAYEILRTGAYDEIVIPNGSILEFGAVYQTARYLGIPCVTYEFGEQRERLWLAQEDEVMRQDTSLLWKEVKDIQLSAGEREKIDTLFRARRGGSTWEQFKRQWQSGESEGALRTRAKLGLDPQQPIALLCTNVVGDSLALNRQVFTTGMTEWLTKTVRLFETLTDYQLIVRVHPGEMLGAGHPSVEIVKGAMPSQGEHVIVVPPDSEINTYDLIELSHLGMVYTTTVGLEMSMHGIPVIVAGATHYKGKGFTEDPESWQENLNILHRLLKEPLGRRLPAETVELAWRYAYRFFFDYPFEIPWHIISFWHDMEMFPLEKVLGTANIGRFQTTLNAFVGQPIDWNGKVSTSKEAEVAVEG